MPRNTWRTGAAPVGSCCPASSCAFRIAARARSMVAAFFPPSARWAKYAATTPGAAGRQGECRSAHQASNRFQSAR
ncbi:MAG: hypothetical protein ACYDCO_15990 [Armatimonadota bacterium]